MFNSIQLLNATGVHMSIKYIETNEMIRFYCSKSRVQNEILNNCYLIEQFKEKRLYSKYILHNKPA